MSEEPPRFSKNDLKGIIGTAILGALIGLTTRTITGVIVGAIIGAIVGATVFTALVRPDWVDKVSEDFVRPLVFRVNEGSISGLSKEICWIGFYPGFHEGEWKYESPNNCIQIRTCERCGVKSRSIKHVWSQWFEESRNVVERFCVRCMLVQRRKIEHHGGGHPDPG